jgi:asparagine synthase (glutamine-hydrolysing)
MCGIAGIVSKHNRPIDNGLIERVTDLVAHRGPDGIGYYFGNNFAFGHRRLSILDLSDHGQQPMVYNERYWIVFNGAIYNYLELRAELEKKGHSFRSATDTEVILAAYAEWGSACCARFNGMWAFAIYDAQDEKIFFSRDRFGIKPLYYIENGEHFAFGSEIKQLLALRSSTQSNRRIVIEYLLTSLEGHTADTFFEGVRSFPQAHYGIYDLNNHTFVVQRFYQLRPDPSLAALSLGEATARFRHLFNDSIRLRLRSDVKVGTCLSGGLDSSATSGVASILYHTHAGQRFVGVHAKSTEPERDESRYAQLAADQFGLDLHVVEPKTGDFIDKIDELIDTQEEPFGSPSVFMAWHVFQKAQALGCKVMLDGQGGDEVLLGYERYFAAFLASLPPHKLLWEALSQSRHSKLSLRDIAFYNLYFTNPSLRIRRLKRRSLLLPQIKNAHDFETIRRSAESFKNVDALQVLEISSLQLPHLLRYEDRNSMRHSIETRLPFLDYRVVEFCISIPVHHKIHNGWTKYILREAMSDVLPASVAWRRDKMGFEAPERTWINSAHSQMKKKIATSNLLAEITDRKHLVDRFDALSLRQKWAYFMIAAWEERFALAS